MLNFQQRASPGRCKKEIHTEIRAEYLQRNTFMPLGSLSDILPA